MVYEAEDFDFQVTHGSDHQRAFPNSVAEAAVETLFTRAGFVDGQRPTNHCTENKREARNNRTTANFSELTTSPIARHHDFHCVPTGTVVQIAQGNLRVE